MAGSEGSTDSSTAAAAAPSRTVFIRRYVPGTWRRILPSNAPSPGAALNAPTSWKPGCAPLSKSNASGSSVEKYYGSHIVVLEANDSETVILG
jgi:hypothetical protein